VLWHANGFTQRVMKTSLFILNIFFSVSAIAQPTVSGFTSPATDTIVFLPQSSISLSGVAVQSNPGHPILDTTWTKTSGPAATITNASNRMTTTITGLVTGNYVFTLTATDKQKTATSSVKVTVVSGILAMDLSYFKVSKNENGVLVTWQTDMESNNARFVIQKSFNGSAFYDVDSISSKAKYGNSSIPLAYSYQITNGNTQADMGSLVLILSLLAFVVVISKLKKRYKYLVLAIASMFLFSCSKSVVEPNQTTANGTTAFRLKQVSVDNHVAYSQIILIN
jgi:hypothetical protein